MQNLPAYISIVFVLTTLFSMFIFVKAANGNRTVLYVLIAWLVLQGVIAYSGFYTNTLGVPPRFTLAPIPTFICMIFLFVTSAGRRFIDSLQLPTLTLLHAVRLPVEIVLFWLFLHKVVPQEMTFEGRNFDIISGVTAPVAAYFARRNNNKYILLSWNILCLCLLVNIVVTAMFAAPFAFQRIAFNQPNVAVLYFPYVWLPAFIVPLVLFSHLVAIRKLVSKSNNYKVEMA
jgi:hypothetical protein